MNRELNLEGGAVTFYYGWVNFAVSYYKMCHRDENAKCCWKQHWNEKHVSEDCFGLMDEFGLRKEEFA